MGDKRFNEAYREPITLYKNQSDLKRALSIVCEVLKRAQDKDDSPISADEEGFCMIAEVVSLLKELEGFEYVNYTHVIELFFKDPDRKILINGDDRIKFKTVRFVKPPKKLYLGTLESLKDRMIESGIRSHTKGYIKLYATESQAISFASKFTNHWDNVTTIAIDADRAFSEGLKFSTYIEDEFIVVAVDKKYIIDTKEGTLER